MVLADDRDECDSGCHGHVADRTPGDRVVAVDRDPVDRNARQLIELGDRLDDARAAEQVGDTIVAVGPTDEIEAVFRAVRDGDGLREDAGA